MKRSTFESLRPPGPLPLAPVLCVLLGPASSGCFPSGVAELWPPRAGDPRYRIDVVYRDWHTVIVAPRWTATPREGEGSRGREIDRHLEWEFAEKAWYLEGRQGSTGVCRALCWPTDSGVHRREVEAPYRERYRGGQVERWTFVVSEAGLERLDAYLESQRADPLPGRPGWYSGRRSYHVCFLCHHFTLKALRRAGLPVAPWWGYAAWMARIQLDRVARLHRKAGLMPARDRPSPSS